MKRTLFVTSRYVVDIFRVAEDAVDAKLSSKPINEIPHWTKYPWGTSTPGSLRRDLTRFERSRDAHSGQYSAMVAQSMDQPASWATEIRRRTGPQPLAPRRHHPGRAGSRMRADRLDEDRGRDRHEPGAMQLARRRREVPRKRGHRESHRHARLDEAHRTRQGAGRDAARADRVHLKSEPRGGMV